MCHWHCCLNSAFSWCWSCMWCHLFSHCRTTSTTSKYVHSHLWWSQPQFSLWLFDLMCQLLNRDKKTLDLFMQMLRMHTTPPPYAHFRTQTTVSHFSRVSTCYSTAASCNQNCERLVTNRCRDALKPLAGMCIVSSVDRTLTPWLIVSRVHQLCSM